MEGRYCSPMWDGNEEETVLHAHSHADGRGQRWTLVGGDKGRQQAESENSHHPHRPHFRLRCAPTGGWPAAGLSPLGPEVLERSGLRGGSAAGLPSPPAPPSAFQLLRRGSRLCLARARSPSGLLLRPEPEPRGLGLFPLPWGWGREPSWRLRVNGESSSSQSPARHSSSGMSAARGVVGSPGPRSRLGPGRQIWAPATPRMAARAALAATASLPQR